MKQLILFLSILACTSLSLESNEEGWRQVGSKSTLSEIIELGLSKESNHNKIEEDLNQLIPLSLDTIASLPSPRVKMKKEWVVIKHSVSTEFSMTPEIFGVRANFEQKKYKVIDLTDEESFDLGINSNPNDLGLFDNKSLFATMKHTVKDGKASIEVVNLWK